MIYFLISGMALLVFLILKLVESSLTKRINNFEENKVRGVAEVVGYERDEHSSWYTLLVKIPVLNDGKIYSCDSAKVNPGDYPKGTMIDVEYAHKTILGIDAVEIRMLDKSPTDVSRVKKVFRIMSWVMVSIFVVMLVLGFVI